MDVVFIVDGSTSICQDDLSYAGVGGSCDNWAGMLTFLQNVINRLDTDGDVINRFDTDGDVRVALVLYSETATTVWGLDRLD